MNVGFKLVSSVLFPGSIELLDPAGVPPLPEAGEALRQDTGSPVRTALSQSAITLAHVLRKTFVLTLSFLLAIFVPCSAATADEFESNGVKIHYVLVGQGDPVVLVHGLHASALTNWQLPGTVRMLARDHLVVAPDCRGHGKSDKPTGEDQYGVQMVEDIVRLMDHLHIARAQVVGYSMGGMIVMKLMALHPERVSDAVLGGMGWLREGSVLDRFWAGLRGNKGTVPPACLRGFSEFGLSADDLKKIKVPFKIIVGDRDPCYQLYVKPLLQVRSDVAVMKIKNAGHLSCVVMPEFKADLKKALAGH